MFERLEPRTLLSGTIGGTGPDDFTFTADDGTQVTVAIKGPGTVQVNANDGDATFDIVANGTTRRTKISITGTGGDGEGFLDGVTINGSLNSFNAADANLEGNMNVTGTVKRIVLDDVGEISDGTQKTMTIGGAGANAGSKVSLFFDDIDDLTINSAIGIKKFRAEKWDDSAGSGVDDSLEAPWLSDLKITIDDTQASSGEFEADVNLTDASKTLKKFIVAREIQNAVIRTAGSIGKFKAQFLQNTTLFAGVDEGVADGTLPQTKSEAGNKKIKKFTLTGDGPGGQAGIDLSYVAAGTLKKVRISDVTLDAEAPYGLAAGKFGSYHSGDQVRMKGKDFPSDGTPGHVEGDYSATKLPNNA